MVAEYIFRLFVQFVCLSASRNAALHEDFHGPISPLDSKERKSDEGEGAAEKEGTPATQAFVQFETSPAFLYHALFVQIERK